MSAEPFQLEPETPGEIPGRVIEELRQFRAVAKDHAQAFSDACKAQAEKHKIPAAALKRYIGALEDDTVEKLDDEARALERLLDR